MGLSDSHPLNHRVKMYLDPFDNYDQIVRTFSVSHFRGHDLSFCDARKAYYSDPDAFMHWTYGLSRPEYKRTGKGFVFSCDGIKIGILKKSTREGSNYFVFQKLVDSGVDFRIDIFIRNGEYFHLNESQYYNSDDFLPDRDDPHQKRFPSWARKKIESYIEIVVNYSDYSSLFPK